MATCLLTWELGEGLGHITVLRSLVDRLLRDHHRVFVASKNVQRVKDAFGDKVFCLQAPHKTTSDVRFPAALNHVHLLANAGFNSDSMLSGCVEAWIHVFNYVKPDLLVFNHSPIAMLAARATQTKTVIIGTGFEIPVDVTPMPVLRSWIPYNPSILVQHEDEVLERANRIMKRFSARPLSRVGELYSDVDVLGLATFPGMDHYAKWRPKDTTYLGCCPHGEGDLPVWPKDGTRIFVYAQPFAGMHHLLTALGRLQGTAIVCVDGEVKRLVEQYSFSNVKITDRLYHLPTIGKECDLAIVTGSHGVTSCMALSGKPCLFIPHHLEQYVTSRNLMSYGLGLIAEADKPTHILDQLELAMTTPRLREAAQRFAHEYRQFSQLNIDDFLERVMAILEPSARTDLQ